MLLHFENDTKSLEVIMMLNSVLNVFMWVGFYSLIIASVFSCLSPVLLILPHLTGRNTTRSLRKRRNHRMVQLEQQFKKLTQRSDAQTVKVIKKTGRSFPYSFHNRGWNPLSFNGLTYMGWFKKRR